jgi:hypothetical protein
MEQRLAHHLPYSHESGDRENISSYQSLIATRQAQKPQAPFDGNHRKEDECANDKWYGKRGIENHFNE